jgi:hypothetical protein
MQRTAGRLLNRVDDVVDPKLGLFDEKVADLQSHLSAIVVHHTVLVGDDAASPSERLLGSLNP